MKNTIITLFLLFTITGLFAQRQGKYFFAKSGHIEYALGGNWAGTKTVWFDDYGMLMYTLTESTSTVTLAGITDTHSEKKLEIRKGKDIWNIDLILNTGTQTSIEGQTQMGRSMTQGKSDAELHQMERKVITDMGGTITGYETFLGKKCLNFTWGTTKFSQYKGIPLKSEVTQTGILTLLETATSFAENIAVPASKFEVPANVEIQKSGGLMELLGGLEGLNGGGEMDDADGAGIPPGLSFEKFQKATKNLIIPGYTFFMDADDKNLYLTNYVKSEEDQVIIFAEHESRFDELVTDTDSQIVKSKYTLNGRKAAFVHIIKEDDGRPIDSRMLITCMPELKTVLYIITARPFTQKELEGFMTQIKL